MQKGSVQTTEEQVEFRWNDQPQGPEWEPAGKVPSELRVTLALFGHPLELRGPRYSHL